MTRFCRFFARTLKEGKDIQRMRITDVTKLDVSNFYT